MGKSEEKKPGFIRPKLRGLCIQKENVRFDFDVFFGAQKIMFFFLLTCYEEKRRRGWGMLI